MATNRKRIGRGRGAAITERSKWHDFSALVYDSEAETPDPFCMFGNDHEALVEYWALFHDELLAEWLSDDRCASTRPSGWWSCAADVDALEDETSAEYLDRVDGWQPGEREAVARHEAHLQAGGD